MALRYYANAPATSLASGCTALATSITVTSTTGLPLSYPYTLIIDRGLATEEAVEVTAASGTDLTVTRGVDGTTAFAHDASAEVVHGITARDVREPNTHVNATDGVHGVTSELVGTDDAQTLTNKTLTAPVVDDPTLNGGLSGTALDWTTWTPTWGNVTVGNGVVTARYALFGKTVHFVLMLQGGTTTTSSTIPTVSLPVAPSVNPSYFYGHVQDASEGHQRAARIQWSSGTGYIHFLDTTTVVWTTPIASWGDGDVIYFSGTYEVD